MVVKKLDALSAAFRDDVEAVVLKYSGGDKKEYYRRWRQLHTWGMDRAHGDINKKDKLKTVLLIKTGSKCEDCGTSFQRSELQMHRIDPQYEFDDERNFGYFEENVALLCRPCHDLR